MKLALIPARGSSKRIPRKNIRMFAGRPMIAHSIAAAQASALFDRIIVSTDDAEIAVIARDQGAETPFLRPAALADDHATTLAVIQHALRWLDEAGTPVDEVCCIYATAPFVQVADLVAAHDRMTEKGADFCFPVTTFPYAIQRALKITDEGRVAMFAPEYLETRSQDLAESYHDAGQFYWGRADAFLAGRPVFGPGSVPLVIPRYRVQDIDTPEDWARAEILFQLMAAQGESP